MRYKAESFDIWQYLCGMVYDPLMRCKIDFSGRVDEETLKHAITESLATIPLMGCCFEGSGRKPYWVDRGFTGEDMVQVVEAGSDTDDEIVRAYSSRIDIEHEPQLKIIIVRTRDGDTMCVIATHLVCDGMGYKEYLHLVADLYTKLRHGEPLPAPRRYRRDTKPLYAQTGFLERLRILRTPQPSSQHELKDQRGVDFHSGESTTFLESRTVSPEDFASFRAFVRANGATVNDGLQALFARAFCRESGTTHMAFTSTIDLRRFIPPGVTYGLTNYAGNCSCAIPVQPGDSLPHTMAEISSQMQMYKSGKYSLRGAIGCDVAVSIFSFTWLKKHHAAVLALPAVAFTNVGILEAADLDFDHVPIRSVSMMGSIKPRPYVQLSASTFEGACTLNCNIYGSQEERLFVDRMLDAMVDEISALPTSVPGGDGGI